jgi:flavin reductase (DIM6/NTAB) family NADH-FMN oxidoreductase RutF
MAITSQEFRAVLGRFTTGVTVVTTCEGSRRAGITVNAFTSVSLDPPLVLICIERTAYIHDILVRSGIYAVNLLTAAQQHLSECFASRSAERDEEFCGQNSHDAVTGAPILDETLAFVDCRVIDIYPGGDHSIFLGRVEALGGGETSPLLYYRGAYSRLDCEQP